ncbi:MAG: hypothetical protein CMH32_06370 [Micavibrio sp.]|nr:hypothetical protein [Micavibrio sp.]HCK32814.1 hypothetical protein [Rhodospirillaceae bacterium]|tara:strand:- start:1390 stop:1887 length:498 start_codon:yes stop_codon:yes gene_type:complete
MIGFNGFEEILMAVIKGTVHSVNQDRLTNATDTITDGERFNNAMKAILGDNYEPHYMRTADLSEQELISIKKLNNDGKSLRSSVKEVVATKLIIRDGNTDDLDDTELKRYVDQAQKHFKKFSDHYEETMPTENKIEHSAFKNIVEEQAREREEIFDALKKAGWDI